MKGPFRDNCLRYLLSFKDERAIQGQLPKVFLPMIGVPDGVMCGKHSWSTSPRSSAYSRDAIEQAPTISLSVPVSKNIMPNIKIT